MTTRAGQKMSAAERRHRKTARARRKSRERDRRYRQRHPETARESGRRVYLRRQYGLTETEYDAMLAEQGGRCAVCRQPPTERLHVDHDHASGRIRGLLCNLCNVAIAHFLDDAEAMIGAASYITKGGFSYASIPVRFVPGSHKQHASTKRSQRRR